MICDSGNPYSLLIFFIFHWPLILCAGVSYCSGLIWSSWSNKIRQLGMCYTNLQPASLLQAISRRFWIEPAGQLGTFPCGVCSPMCLACMCKTSLNSRRHTHTFINLYVNVGMCDCLLQPQLRYQRNESSALLHISRQIPAMY